MFPHLFKKTFLLIILLFSNSDLLPAQSFQAFDLNSFLSSHPIASSFDTVTRHFKASRILANELASVTHQIEIIENNLKELEETQQQKAAAIFATDSAFSEQQFWQENRELGKQERELRILERDLTSEQSRIQQLFMRDIGILPDIKTIVSDMNDCLKNDKTIYLNYLPAVEATTQKEWLSSPLQIYFWSPKSRYIEDYLDHSYSISNIFSFCRQPVVYQKDSKRKR